MGNGTLNFETRMSLKEIVKTIKPLEGKMVVAEIKALMFVPTRYVIGKIDEIRVKGLSCYIVIDGSEFSVGVDSLSAKITALYSFDELEALSVGGRLTKLVKYFVFVSGKEEKLLVAHAMDGYYAAYLIFKKKGIKEIEFCAIWSHFPQVEEVL